MKPSKPSCVVALSTERNCATDTDSATEGATGTAHISRKPLSLRELRAQLRAQLARNHGGNDPVVGADTTAAPFDQEWFDERAAILEYDAGFSREEAERRAMKEVVTHG